MLPLGLLRVLGLLACIDVVVFGLIKVEWALALILGGNMQRGTAKQCAAVTVFLPFGQTSA
jgi:hypothetical protein